MSDQGAVPEWASDEQLEAWARRAEICVRCGMVSPVDAKSTLGLIAELRARRASHAPQGVRVDRETLEQVREALAHAMKHHPHSGLCEYGCACQPFEKALRAALSALDGLMGGEG